MTWLFLGLVVVDVIIIAVVHCHESRKNMWW